MSVVRHCLAAAVVACALAAIACGGSESSISAQGAREVRFNSTDGISLDGHVFGQGSHWVILSHMFPADQTSWYGFARRLATKGLVALTYDFRGYGASTGRKEISRIAGDTLGAIAYARSQGATTVALVGASMGGTASVIAAAEAPSGTAVPVLALLSAPVSFMGLDAGGAAARVQVATMICVAGTRDNGGAQASAAQTLCAAPGSGIKTSVVLPDTDSHGTALLDDPAATQAIDDVVATLASTAP